MVVDLVPLLPLPLPEPLPVPVEVLVGSSVEVVVLVLVTAVVFIGAGTEADLLSNPSHCKNSFQSFLTLPIISTALL
ncbi:MAG: hypothetical protein HDS68_07720 [Bacteroidales bacterium]|nr:hypothetical protein [Bacteroidales bacterium]